MKYAQLCSIDVANFRSIRGHIHAPLDAKVVLVHGENGAGKTSLLSAIELALTGRVDALRRADPDYQLQLLHKRALSGYAEVSVSTEEGIERFRTELAEGKVSPGRVLDDEIAEFFGERAYLPQSLLGQLLQIYQDAGSDSASPLARFVSSLLGLDRLDALEAGLKPLADVRNVRKVIDGWSTVEIEKGRLEPLIKDQWDARKSLEHGVLAKRGELRVAIEALGIVPNPEIPEQVSILATDREEDDAALARLTDQLRVLASIRRDMADQSDSDASMVESELSDGAERSTAALRAWQESYGDRSSDLRARVETLIPHVAFSPDLNLFRAEALRLLAGELAQSADKASRGRVDARQLAEAQDQLVVANEQLMTIDRELSAIASNSGSLSAALAEISSFIIDDVCPVCDRNYAELDHGALSDHVHAKTRSLSSSADRLIALGRSRSDQQASIERLQQSIGGLASRQIDEESLAAIDRRTTEVVDVQRALDALGPALESGQRLIEADVAARQRLTKTQQSSGRRLAIRGNLNELANSISQILPGEGETIEAFADRIELALTKERDRLTVRIRNRAAALEAITAIRTAKSQMEQIDSVVSGYQAAWDRNEAALQRAQALRSDGLKIRDAVDAVRSSIIRREFNDRLNRLWRDLFVRLAPGEEFVPAFRIPEASTQRLQPKLYTPHRDLGDDVAGGTPGAMLSAGNLNTAALTLFIALHLSVPVQLPWLILDDPVQSMDDIHIAHFAALLRTLSKEHSRQVMIAVHDRQLFEYLRLELSPAFSDDSLITLELNRSSRRDSQCIATRHGFREETALRVA
ncbi:MULTISPECIES: AAA family ATPase [Mesorhizobium]|uniref:AAA family ATPase n=1 Tax=Mesorhizobium TaxID=68287 RepID=UPI0010A95119|nr:MULTISPECIES: AAA family ATPase [Mesorhizobium]